jgi:hypothetical protein
MWMATKQNGTGIRPTFAQRDLRRTRHASPLISIAFKLCAGMAALALILLPGHVAAAEKAANPRTAKSPMTARQGAPNQSAADAQPAENHHRAHFGQERASHEARQIADWIVDSADNLGLPFVIVDKIDARLFVFDADGRLRGASAALLGSARGDDTVPGIGDREYADMPPETRTTPAGRFVAALGQDSHGQDVLWVDYEAAVAIHRVITTKPEERRLERLATPTPRDNRISYGCINVPARFYENVVGPTFTRTDGIVYVLPESRPAREAFGAYDVKERLGRRYAGQADVPRQGSEQFPSRRGSP